MNSLQLFTGYDSNTLDSREVAEMVEKRHSDLLRDIETYIGYMEQSNERKVASVDFFTEATYQDAKGETRKRYLITRKGCEFIANKLTGRKGTQFTAAYINRFHEMENQTGDVPRSLPEALRLAADLAEQKELLLDKIDTDAPKVLFADSVATSKSSILIGELAKILKQNGVVTGQNRLFEWLRDNGYLISRKGTDYNMPTQYSMELGLFEIKETTVTHADGHISVSKTPKVTGKGQIYFVQKLRLK